MADTKVFEPAAEEAKESQSDSQSVQADQQGKALNFIVYDHQNGKSASLVLIRLF